MFSLLRFRQPIIKIISKKNIIRHSNNDRLNRRCWINNFNMKAFLKLLARVEYFGIIYVQISIAWTHLMGDRPNCGCPIFRSGGQFHFYQRRNRGPRAVNTRIVSVLSIHFCFYRF